MNLQDIKNKYQDEVAQYGKSVVICAGTGCMANGSMDIYLRFLEEGRKHGYRLSVALHKEEGDGLLKQSGCQGFCQMGPLVTILPEEIFYVKVKPEDVEEIIETSLIGDGIVERLLYEDDERGKIAHHNDISFYARQRRTTLKLCGEIDAEDIEEYISKGGYAMAERAVLHMTDEEVCQEVIRSGLRGRGGGGFPTGKKWDITRQQKNDIKYVICNGDEGDPGAFMDRCLMEGNPHSLLEGMIIAAKAVGASEGYIYVRMEYPLAVKRLNMAVKDALLQGFLGKNIFGSGMNFDIHIMEGAGAFVCGEETALIHSIEGKRGMPTPKPPYPAQSGLFGKPTVINNVETLSSVPVLMMMGVDNYAALGTETSSGTKTFALTGHVAHTGLIEVPFGATLREIVAGIGGGVIRDDGTNAGADFKAVQIGGPSGGCLTHEHMDMPLDYENLQRVGAMVGSGGLVVINQDTCMIQIAKFFMQFTQNESCGKCTVCREGTKQMLNLLEEITQGRGTLEILDLLEKLANTVRVGSLCGLGKTAPNPVLSTLRYFRNEYLDHIVNKRCTAKVCKAFKRTEIDPAKCKSCSLCARKCPMEAITGSKGVPYVINQEACIHCGVCAEICKFDAVITSP